MEYAVRLTGGTTDAVGRIEVYINSMWRPVCSYSDWGRDEGLAVCKQLGFAGLLNTFPSNDFGQVQATSGITGISCAGSEVSLADCNWDTSNTSVSPHCPYMAAICSGEHKNVKHALPV